MFMTKSVFKYDDFVVSDDKKTVKLNYSLSHNGESFKFTEVYVFAVELLDTAETYQLLRALHLASGISYYKIFVCKNINHPYAMTADEAEFWNTVFVNGLGEFLYVNKIKPTLLAKFKMQKGQESTKTERVNFVPKVLLGIGGGKDSVVAGELLKSINVPVSGFVLATGDATGQTYDIAKIMDVSMQKIERTIDASLIKLQQRPDAHKGHVPISVLFAITGCLLAVADKTSYVVVANESSASIPGIQWEGQDINHQWSKSYEFELMMQSYIYKYVSNDMYYFSAIRPLSSVAVAKIFCKYSKYFNTYTSDNYSFRVDPAKRPKNRWSLDSPKSLSSFILMSAWLNQEQLVEMFGRNFLNEPILEYLLFELTGLKGEVPLDCVGTPEELCASLRQAYDNGTCIDSVLMRVAKNYEIVGTNDPDLSTTDTFLNISEQASFPLSLERLLNVKIKELIA